MYGNLLQMWHQEVLRPLPSLEYFRPFEEKKVSKNEFNKMTALAMKVDEEDELGSTEEARRNDPEAEAEGKAEAGTVGREKT